LPGKFFGVGVGPGNPQLITIKASQVLMTVDVICAPKSSPKKSSYALKTVRTIIKTSNKRQETIELVYPMVKDRKLMEGAVERNAEIIVSRLRGGKNVAFITLGDPMLYSTFINTYRKVVEKLPEVEVEIIPGVTSLSACAAASRIPIAEAEEAVVIIPATSNLEKLEMLAQQADTIIFMKGIKDMEGLFKALTRSGFGENSQAVVAANIGTPSEEVRIMKLHELRKMKGESYFSTIIVRRESP
jgi:precorrin-2/cobalt-factor-2 C20-methyltransferase